jgi:cytochrome b pre-mRNA-processing protein 3
VGKTMRKLGEAFYGRGKSLTAALEALPDEAPLAALVARTVFAGAAPADPGPLAAHLLRLRADLAETPADTLLAGALPWNGQP